MKYEEKQRRKTLKLKIGGVAAASCLLIAYMAAPSTSNTVAYTRWESNTGDLNHNVLIIDETDWKIGAQFKTNRVINRTKDPDPNYVARLKRQSGTTFFVDKGWYNIYPGSTHSFAGFGYLRNSSATHSYATEWWGVTIPVWFPFVVPALLVLHWCRQMKHAGNKESRFPVIMK